MRSRHPVVHFFAWHVPNAICGLLGAWFVLLLATYMGLL